jgi:hypothetical protein
MLLMLITIFTGISTTVLSAAVLYVDVNNSNGSPPYSSWTTAASAIQDAIEAASAGDEILVTNGIYVTGGKVASGSLTNRVAITKPLAVRSVNGPNVTVIQGYQLPGMTTGDGAIRCAYLVAGATLSGFTITKGATRAYPFSAYQENQGGGVYCESSAAIVSNCVLTGNAASFYGGGASQGKLMDCVLSNNTSSAGGGAAWGTLENCRLSGNVAENGGGADQAELINCSVNGNSARGEGGGVKDCSLTNCTVTGNSAFSGGGAFRSTLDSCIVYFNTAPQEANYSGCALTYCCTQPPPPSGVGNFVDDPLLANAVYISAGSPCRGAGNQSHTSGVDIDGEAWLDPPS